MQPRITLLSGKSISEFDHYARFLEVPYKVTVVKGDLHWKNYNARWHENVMCRLDQPGLTDDMVEVVVARCFAPRQHLWVFTRTTERAIRNKFPALALALDAQAAKDAFNQQQYERRRALERQARERQQTTLLSPPSPKYVPHDPTAPPSPGYAPTSP